MTDVMDNLIVDVHPSRAKSTLFVDGNGFLIASTVRVYSLPQTFLRVLEHGSTRSLINALYDRCSSTFAIVFLAM